MTAGTLRLFLLSLDICVDPQAAGGDKIRDSEGCLERIESPKEKLMMRMDRHGMCRMRIIKSKFIVMNYGTISNTVPWLKSVTFIEP